MAGQQIIPPIPHTPAPSPDLATHLLNIIERLTIIEQMSASVMTEQDEAKVSRRSLHEKLATITTEVSGVKSDVKNLQEKVDDMKPVLALHERLRNQLTGGVIVVGFLWSVALLAAGYAIKAIWLYFTTR
jgi:hypothetical protein